MKVAAYNTQRDLRSMVVVSQGVLLLSRLKRVSDSS